MKPEVTAWRVPVRSAAPQAIALARGLGWLYGKAIRGDNGAVRYGYPGLDTNRGRYSGYAFPPQAFRGYDPRKVAAGTARPDPAGFPGESVSSRSDTALMRAMDTVTWGVR
jgi:hypothetical protein